MATVIQQAGAQGDDGDPAGRCSGSGMLKLGWVPALYYIMFNLHYICYIILYITCYMINALLCLIDCLLILSVYEIWNNCISFIFSDQIRINCTLPNTYVILYAFVSFFLSKLAGGDLALTEFWVLTWPHDFLCLWALWVGQTRTHLRAWRVVASARNTAHV